MAEKKPIVRYLEHGVWKDATVRDIGDLQQLNTLIKTDLVSAINSIQAGVNPDLDQVIKDMLESIDGIENGLGSVQNQITNGTLNEVQRAEMDASIKVVKDSIDAINKELNGKIETIKSDYNSKIDQVNNTLEQAKTDISTTLTNLEKVKEELSAVELNVLTITQSVDNIKGEILQKVDKTEFDLTEAEVKRQKTAIEQNAEKIALSASKEELNLATDRVAKVEADLTIQADEIKSKVSHEEVREEIEKIDKYQPNLLRNTRDWKDWANNDIDNIVVKTETYELRHIVEIKANDTGLSQTVEGLEIGKTYTVSVYVKASTGSELWLDNGVLTKMTFSDGDPTLTGEWIRFRVSFVATDSAMPIRFVFKNLVGTGMLSGSKLELGSKTSGWQPHADDIYERTIRNESEIKQNADRIAQSVETIEKQGEDIVANKTVIDQQSESIKLQSERTSEIEGLVSQNKSAINLMDDEIKLKVERTEVGDMIQDINIDNKNRILNSDFARDTEKWTVNKAFKLVDVGENKMLHVNRTGLTSDLSVIATSNSFPVKQGDRVMFGFDFKADVIPDKDTVATLEILDIRDVRVDFKETSLTDKYINDGTVQRINDSFVIKREDAAKARIVFSLKRNGSVYFGLSMAQLGDIKSTDWSLAPEDVQTRRIQMESEIKILENEISLKASSAEMDAISEKANTNEANIKLFPEEISLSVTESKQYADEKAGEAEGNAKAYSDAQIKIESDKITQKVSSFEETLVGVEKKTDKKVESITNEYYLSDSETVLEGGEWTEISPQKIQGKHIWVRTKVILGDGTFKYTPNETGTCISGSKGDDGESNYSVMILSTEGDTFKNGIIETKLQARIFYGDEDITDNIDSNKFRWTRSSIDKASDDIWNEKYFGGAKEIKITSDDVHKRAMFQCELTE